MTSLFVCTAASSILTGSAPALLQELADTIQRLRQQLRKKDEHVADLEEYIDSLLLKVMASDPSLLVTQANKMGAFR
jgi:predicted ATPase